jgi:chemotaxis protein MotA
MDFATTLGIILGFGILGTAIFFGASEAAKFFVNIPGIGIVLGGTIAATLLSFPLREVLRIFKVVLVVFKKEKESLGPHVDEVVELARSARLGITEIEKVLPNVKNPFLRDGIQMIVDGYAEEEIRDILENRIINRTVREHAEANVFKTMGKFAPAFGMLGTLIGLVGMLASLGEAGAEAAKNIGPNMAVALITTFYGVLLANLLFNPIAEKFESRVQKETILQNMLIEAVSLLYNKKHPLIVREKLNSFIPPREWKREGEEAKAEKAAA